MITRELIKDESGTINLVRTYSTEGLRLIQQETGILYSSSAIDVIAGYDEQNIPYSRYTYKESDVKEGLDD